MIIAVKIISWILAAITVGLIILLDYWPNNKRTILFRKRRKCLVILFVFSTLGSIGLQIYDYYDEIQSYRNIIDSIYGKGYGMVTIVGEPKNDEVSYWLTFGNLTHEPIYDVVISFDTSGTSSCQGFDCFKTYNLGSVVPERHIPLGTRFQFNSDKVLHYNFYIGTRNGIYRQELFCHSPIGNELMPTWVTKLFKYNHENRKYEEIKRRFLPNFPIPLDKIEWELNY